MKQKCERTRFQPLLIVFTNGSGSLVDTQKAPQHIETVSKEILLKVHPPSTKPSVHRKQKNHHNRKHKRGRQSSRSPLPSPDKSVSERVSSRSSNGSLSPSSPRRVASDLNGQNNRAHESYHVRLNDVPVVNSRPPKALLSMKGSASDGSIADLAGDDRDLVDVRRKRSGSVKRRMGDVFKSMKSKKNHSKSNKNNNNNNNTAPTAPSIDHEQSVPTSAVVADVGYISPYNKRSNNKDNTPPRSPKPRTHHHHKGDTPPRSPRLAAKHQHNSRSTSAENSPQTQRKNMELHQENIAKSNHSQNHKHKHQSHSRQNGHTAVTTKHENHNGYAANEYHGEFDHTQKHNGVHSRPEIGLDKTVEVDDQAFENGVYMFHCLLTCLICHYFTLTIL